MFSHWLAESWNEIPPPSDAYNRAVTFRYFFLIKYAKFLILHYYIDFFEKCAEIQFYTITVYFCGIFKRKVRGYP